MKKARGNGKRNGGFKFPKYLKIRPENRHALLWLGERLKAIRGEKSVSEVAKSGGVKAEEIEAVERGQFHLNLGRIWRLVQHGYNASFEELIAECYKQNRQHLDHVQEDRKFERDYYYSVRFAPHDGKEPTPFLVGGNPESFLWAIPMRKLLGQPIITEFLELAPLKKRMKPGQKEEIGALSKERHEGIEMLYVIHGEIHAHIFPNDRPYFCPLKAGDCIHLHSSESHFIQNSQPNTSAFVLVVRIPKLVTPANGDLSNSEKSYLK